MNPEKIEKINMSKPNTFSRILAEDYLTERKKRGTQAQVARKLLVHPITICKRETGIVPITEESWLALLSLPIKKLSG
jgi:hypothetical protein